MFIDIHSHLDDANEINGIKLQDKVHFVGIHPWFIESNTLDDEKTKIKTMLDRDSWCLIGETGLDRLKSEVEFDLQLDVFNWHLNLAKQYHRPLVIHCLKAHSDFLEILKKNQLSLTFLIHDYSGGESELKEYLKFNIYFSFGHSLFREQSKAQMVFKKVPNERIFFETDDQKNYSIEQIYQKASELVPHLNWESICEKNLESFFRNFKNVSSTDIINHFRT